MDTKKIIYVSGEGHSGSTLLDIVLGSQKNAFSAGELIFFPQKGIQNKEFCACGKQVPDCELWEIVIDKWDQQRTLTLKAYIQNQQQLTGTKNLFSTQKKLKKPDPATKAYLEDTRRLYEIIFSTTQVDTIIDSSKTPMMIPILRKIGFDIVVIHLTRRFGDVLNSYKKVAKKDLKAGIEHDLKPLKTSYIFLSWFSKNLLTYMLSSSLGYKKIKYEHIVAHPSKCLNGLVMNDESYSERLKNRGPFYPMHLVAGNKIRMNKDLHIAEAPMNSSYHRLNRVEKVLARTIDYFY